MAGAPLRGDRIKSDLEFDPPRIFAAPKKQIRTGSKKPRLRGVAQASLDLIEQMRFIAQAAQPITGRGVGYKLFTAGLTPSMETRVMACVYR